MPDFENTRPPLFYEVYRAAKTLNCSFIELFEHKDCLTLIGFARSIRSGENEGDYQKELNPHYQSELVKIGGEISEIKEFARKANGKT